LRLFTERGFHETTVDQIAAEAGVSRRTFFRYYDAKAEVLWAEFDNEVATIRATLAEAPGDVPAPPTTTAPRTFPSYAPACT
jgi:AcrR family transcriptional regulator